MADNGDKREHTSVEKTCSWDIMIIMGILKESTKIDLRLFNILNTDNHWKGGGEWKRRVNGES